MSAIKKAIEMLNDAADNLMTYHDENGNLKVLHECLDDDAIIYVYKQIRKVQNYLEALNNILNPSKYILELIETGQYNISRLKPFVEKENRQ